MHITTTSDLNEGFSLLSQKELGVLFTPPIGGENVESRKGLESERKLELNSKMWKGMIPC